MKDFLYRATTWLLPFLLWTKNRQQLSILIYHRIMPELDFMRPTEPTVAEFEWQMDLLSRYFNPLSLSEALQLMDYGELPPRAVCVTFDDGYSDNEELALPILKRLNVPATVFVTTGQLNGGRMWNDTIIETLRIAKGDSIDLTGAGLGVYDISNKVKRFNVALSIIKEVKHWSLASRDEAVRAVASLEMDGLLPNDLMMSDEQVKNLSINGIEIGAHTETHPILATLDLAAAKREICAPKEKLELLIGRPVEHFAYPNGRPGVDYRVEHRDLSELAGYNSAVSTHWGVASKVSDRWQLPRFTPWDKTPFRFLVRLLLNFRSPS